MQTTQILTGHDALDALRAGKVASVNKYTDPVEEAREGLSLDEAVEVAREDASLLWVEVEQD